MQVLIHRLKILLYAVSGLFTRYWYTIFKFNKKDGLNTEKREKELIVSLTTYGWRVEKLLFATLISLLKQTCKPDRVVVWLDQTKWSDDNLPERLIPFKQMGVEFKFCEDIRSYTKLVPSLLEFPNAIIVTVDDDIYYRSNLLKDLYDSYLKNPKNIHTAVAHQPIRDEQGNLLSYNQWSKNVSNTQYNELFPTGVGGVLYPPNSLHKDVSNKELFQKLAPTADDVWFWVMAKMNNTKYSLAISKEHLPTDWFYEYFNTESSLMHENVYRSANDKQIQQVLKHYDLK